MEGEGFVQEGLEESAGVDARCFPTRGRSKSRGSSTSSDLNDTIDAAPASLMIIAVGLLPVILLNRSVHAANHD